MEIRKTDIPADSLIRRFCPADYTDAFRATDGQGIGGSPDDILINFWTDMPGWVNGLFRLRNRLVRLVGLKGGDERAAEVFEKCIREGGRCEFAEVTAKDSGETVIVMRDKHLDAYLSVRKCDETAVFTNTLVRYHNRLGKVYFFIIRPFHDRIVRSTLKRAVKKYRGQTKPNSTAPRTSFRS